MIAPQTGPTVRKAFEVLRDGDWHDYRQVVDEVGKTIPPGRALRKAEKARHGVRGTAPAERVREVSTDALIQFGARAITRDLLSNVLLFEISPRGRVPDTTPKQIRLTPEGFRKAQATGG